MHKKLQIQIEGTYEKQYSLSLVNKAIALALNEHSDAEISLSPTRYHADYMKTQEIEETLLPFIEKQPDTIDITIRNIYPPYATEMRGYHKIIGPYGWEESKFPEAYVRWFNSKLTMVFAMSTYVENLLKDNGVHIPVVTTGLVVEDILHIEEKSFSFPLPEGFRLLHISSLFPRKGGALMLEAFEQIQNISSPLSLIIKTFPNPHNTILEQINARGFTMQVCHEEGVSLFVKDKKSILLINKDISRSQIRYLYAHSDLLLAPSYGEGFGLPMAEAMLMDLPVVTTGYGGQRDFCTPETAWLIDYRMEEADTHLKTKGSLWAVPILSSLLQQIQTIMHLNEKEKHQKTEQAKKYIQEHYSAKKVAHAILNAIKNYEILASCK